MKNLAKRVGAAALAACGLLAVAPAAHAQVPFRPVQAFNQPFIPTQLQSSALRQWAFNTAVIGRTYAQIPPYLFGYNPYPQAINFGPVYQPRGFIPPVVPYNPLVNPYLGGGYSAAPGYAGGYAPGLVNGTYGSGAGGYTPGYDSLTNPYYGYGESPIGGYLRGSAAVIGAYGNLSLQNEQARIMREMANQAKLDTMKKRLDTLAYIRDNTPTFTQEQARIARQTLQRIQSNATPTEIWTGKSLNVLLQDLGKQASKKPAVETITLDEDVLKRLNVASKDGSNIGLLRHDGVFTWPTALSRLTASEDRTTVEKEVQALVKQANNAQVDQNRVSGVREAVEKMREKLTRSVNEVPTQQYLDATRFLNDFEAALRALETGDASRSFDFQSKFAVGGKTAHDLVTYMKNRGLHFAPATPGDEDAYHAAHSALVAYSVALENQQVASNNNDNNKE